MTNSRQIAFIALRDVHKGAYTDVALDRALQKANLSDIDRRLVTELLYGSVRRQRTLDFIIDQLAKKKSHQQPTELRSILHLGLYQLRYQERIPASAAVNTTVELAKDNGFAGLTGFVNGLLRQYIRLAEASPDFLELPENPVERLGILHSFPDWIIKVWWEQLGLTETEKLCEWMNQTPTLDLRVNPLLASVAEVETALKSAGVLARPIPHLPQALRLIGNNGSIQKLPGFSQGWWIVQDASAQLVGHLLDPQPGEVIIDACAAPGGKTTHIAELMKDEGKVWAGDRTASRLRKLKENAQRLNLHSIEICIGDSRNLPQFYDVADRVLLDAPCSGLGTLHRHADARWRQTPESVQELSMLQKELLAHTSKFVKVGGVLVYATCTLHPAENEEVITEFVAGNSDWQIEPPRPDSPYSAYTTPQGWLKVWPHNQDMDGFFMVRLRKTNVSE
ncbi:16S rRNA (cytosine(967)-C(5))-methyltransferase [Anabaena sp. FACHB-709]|uniref:16S rRNA (cytosine(967)-C(5))-methyltransferase n=2 Tax=Nostocaceae TaxID=1162 RepID=A0A1Z4KSE2_ANAVA|nr:MULTISPECIES: 16S rRNA (cytosine(967)-C(5))-methyltransferase [Nostocaceae]BAY71792.1 sun protein [Trichormus variabilis NIES-23]HBW33700.1 16S rRNA (cytosine(967)-C(5))-methyltransferase [Nostoc sp. UBA8866]MBD2172302.1 16S rRNA (cytosine(967)-C(5))-methyltransferase [Anabaena cylindrica FACHB-318]MBD2263877.1 16S rRNA (cytosine(967)-C(5))-methyltransferase [Anabaena sp. FACHB-709]MBD2273242.1 16S rRNA (cytosine(967)-C(5))-methyltransferase [Nostoc sp. PCC 7120 = FACHB-418]